MNGADESHGDDQGMEAERLAALLQALVEADEADIILLAGTKARRIGFDN